MTARRQFIRSQCVKAVLEVEISRSGKSNAINNQVLDELHAAVQQRPAEAKAILIYGAGSHFSAGMDLVENADRSTVDVMRNSRHWHHVFNDIQFCGLPVIACLRGAVIGGGLELALACHVRVSAPSAIFQLPEAQRGLFVGGGATVRVSRLIGADRMTAMMLTGAVYNAEEGFRLGFSHYLVSEEESLEYSRDLAVRLTSNDPLANFFAINAVSHVNDMPREAGFFTEALVVAVAQAGNDADARRRLFESRTNVFRKGAVDSRGSSS